MTTRAHRQQPRQNRTKSPISLTPKEKRVLQFIELYIRDHGVAPSFQEICDEFGLASFNSVQNYLKQLSAKAYIEISPYQKRSIRVIQSADMASEHIKSLQRNAAAPEAAQNLRKLNSVSTAGSSNTSLLQSQLRTQSEILSLPLLGAVAAGVPLESRVHDEFFEVSKSLVRNPARSYVLKVKGQSMIDDGIFDGDFLIVQNDVTASKGEIVIASIDGEATVKRFFPKARVPLEEQNKVHFQKDVEYVELRPANPLFRSQYYPANKVEIMGVLTGLVRKF